jgi:DNA-directed RNA polymerase specialized sigma24 family protein
LNGFLPAALTRRRRNGTLYERRPEIEAALGTLLGQTREEITAALQIRDTGSARFIASECLVHLIRRTRFDNHPEYFERLYKELMRRIQAALPRFAGERINQSEKVRENAHAAASRDSIRDAFIAKLIADRQEPGPDLDYFEVMFNHAIASLRATATARARRASSRHQTIEFDEKENEPSAEVEQAFARFSPRDEMLSDDPIYRRRVAAAIEGLPDKQRQVIALMLQDFPLDSIDPTVVSIRSILDVSEKTVRNRRDAAFETIRRALEIGNGDD